MPERLFRALQAHGPSAGLVARTGRVGADELLRSVDDLATRFGRQRCRVVAVLAENGTEWVSADLAALRAGVPHLPLPQFFTSDQLLHALDCAGVDCVLTDQPARIASLDRGFVRDHSFGALTWLRREAKAVPLPRGTNKISFTSGSTGGPRGACLSAAGLVDTGLALCEALEDVPVERHLSVLPLALLLENVAGVYAPLLRGADVVLPRLAEVGWRGMSGFDPGALATSIESARAHSTILVPELLKGWALWLLRTRRRAPGTLRFVAVGGARTDPVLIRQARELGLPVYEGYGLTECGSVVCLNHPGADQPGTVGCALPHVYVSVGADRQIHVTGRAFRGYLGDGSAVPDTWPTGDLGYLDTRGFLTLTGRGKNVIVTAYGRNVSPEWVEAALTATAAVRQAVVFGEGRPWLCARLTPAPGADAAMLAAAVASANDRLPDYARVRAWFEGAPLSPLDGLATGNGRPRRGALAAYHVDDIERLYQKENALP